MSSEWGVGVVAAQIPGVLDWDIGTTGGSSGSPLFDRISAL